MRNTTAPQMYALRMNGKEIRSADVVDLYWQARQAVNGTDVRAEVEAISGPSYVYAMFSDATLAPWERVAV